MIKVYIMPTCPDCQVLMDKLNDTSQYEVIDIGTHVLHMKQFIHIISLIILLGACTDEKYTDTSSSREGARKNGWVGIPCFVLKDGTVTLDPKEAGLA